MITIFYLGNARRTLTNQTGPGQVRQKWTVRANRRSRHLKLTLIKSGLTTFRRKFLNLLFFQNLCKNVPRVIFLPALTETEKYCLAARANKNISEKKVFLTN